MTTNSTRSSVPFILIIVNYFLFTAPFFFIPFLFMFIGQFYGWGESAIWRSFAFSDATFVVSMVFSLTFTIGFILAGVHRSKVIAMSGPVVLILAAVLINFLFSSSKQ